MITLTNGQIGSARVGLLKLNNLFNAQGFEFLLGIKIDDWLEVCSSYGKKLDNQTEKLAVKCGGEPIMIPQLDNNGKQLRDKTNKLMEYWGGQIKFGKSKEDQKKMKDFDKKSTALNDKKIEILNVEFFNMKELKGINFTRQELKSLRPLIENGEEVEKAS